MKRPLSLTYFVDFVMKAGSPKLTVVRNFKADEESDYEAVEDFYRPLRRAIVAMHQAGKPKGELDKVLSNLTDKKKQSAYPALVTAYKKFLGSKTTAWFKPPSATWTSGPFLLRVNPEIGLTIGGVRYVVKLYFKQPALKKDKGALLTHLMATALSAPADTEFAVLDVRNGKLFSCATPTAAVHPLLIGEAAGFVAMYDAL